MPGPPQPPPGWNVKASNQPGVGIVERALNSPVFNADHFIGFGAALDQALYSFGRAAPGPYNVKVNFTASVHVTNPGVIIEYIATLV